MGARCGKITERKEQEEVDDESASNTNANGDIGIQTQVFPPPDINVTIVPDSIDAANGTDTSPGAKNTHNEDVERRDDMEAVVHQGASSAAANSNDIADIVAKPHAAKVLPHSVYVFHFSNVTKSYECKIKSKFYVCFKLSLR